MEYTEKILLWIPNIQAGMKGWFLHPLLVNFPEACGQSLLEIRVDEPLGVLIRALLFLLTVWR